MVTLYIFKMRPTLLYTAQFNATHFAIGLFSRHARPVRNLPASGTTLVCELNSDRGQRCPRYLEGWSTQVAISKRRSLQTGHLNTITYDNTVRHAIE